MTLSFMEQQSCPIVRCTYKFNKENILLDTGTSNSVKVVTIK